MADAIEVKNLTKTFGTSVAVDHISFSVKEGEIFGFLGPNGAGKTTTTRMLTGVIPPDAGSAISLVMTSGLNRSRQNRGSGWCLKPRMPIPISPHGRT